MPHNNHSRLYKYLSFAGALGTLSSGEFWMQKPTSFNDPFDMQFDPIIPISASDIRDINTNKILHAHKSGELKSYLGLEGKQNIPEILKARFEELTRMDPAELKKTIELENGVREYETFLIEAQKNIKRALENCFVYCLTSHQSHHLMWAHYADSHKGAVIGFKQNKAEQLSFINYAREVKYQEMPPGLGRRDEWLRWAANIPPFEFSRSDVEAVLTTKSLDWKYESEWRLVIAPQDERFFEGTATGKYQFYPDEVGTVYLGCRMPASEKSQLLQICEAKYPSAEVVECKKKPGSFLVHTSRLR